MPSLPCVHRGLDSNGLPVLHVGATGRADSFGPTKEHSWTSRHGSDDFILGSTPPAWAADAASVEAVEILPARGADVNARNNRGSTVLME
ncbi:hypothetical protein ACFL2Q_12535, partial [Thermodesulfobacteriota bacterium]